VPGGRPARRRRTVHVRRPGPELVGEIGQRLGEIVDEVRLSDLVAAIPRATAYRAVRDFLNQLKASHQVHYPEASH
jgi:hypothetical protein